MIDETVISKAITETFYKEFLDDLESDVIICGAGPSGLCAAYYLGKAGVKVVVLEKALRPGGGLPGGGMMFNKIVIQEEARTLLDELQIHTLHYKDNYYTASSLETLSLLLSNSIKQGVHIYNCIYAEDVMIVDERVRGVVINWTAVELAKMHVDPLTMKSSFVVDATGHDAELAHLVSRKSGAELLTPTGGVMGERTMWADKGERVLIENTKEAFPGLYVTGMAANAVFGGPRMGPIFGGMLLSGKKASQLILDKLKKQKS
ncbi:MAG TPA: sulfide-dependent adenosine diphosphate thiazole synthase [Acidobacteriota bacterium]|nr:sulfide-dependent adenosine diphosphate thiazole synthase [Acidobacteriota bacterium]